MRCHVRPELVAAALAVVVSFGAAGCDAGVRTVSTSATPQSRSPRSETATPGIRAGVQADVRKKLRRLEASFQGRIGAFALDTGTGEAISYRGNERFAMASTFKAIAVAAILDKARRSDPGLLDRRIRWGRGDLMPNSPVTGKYLDTGRTVAQLCHASITFSDNTASNLLLQQLGGPAGLTRYFHSLGDPISRLDSFEIAMNDWRPGQQRNTTTPAAMGQSLVKVTVGSALAGPDRTRLIGWLRANTTGDRRIRAGLPVNWTIGDKTGTPGSYGGAHDIAIAWPPSGAPLIIAIYTNRRSAGAAPDEGVVADTATILARGLGKLP